MNFQDIVLSEAEQVELSRRIRSATISQRDGRRARVILLAAQGRSRNEIAQLTGLSVVSASVFKSCVYKAWWICPDAVASHPCRPKH